MRCRWGTEQRSNAELPHSPPSWQDVLHSFYRRSRARLLDTAQVPEQNLKSTGRPLDSAGWNVEGFTDPIAFLEQAAMYFPDVAVIDILMPEMSGLEVQTRLRNVSPSTRVIVLSAKDDPSVRRVAMNRGASFFIKGVESSEFLAGVKAAADASK